MPKVIRNLLASVGLAEDTVAPVEMSSAGALRIDASELVENEAVQRQIQDLDALIKDGTVKIEPAKHTELHA